MKFNLGCGFHTPPGWINVDYALGAKLLKVPFFGLINKRFKFFRGDWGGEVFVHDLTKTFPWDDDCADYIYSSHTLEHLTRNEGVFFLKECYRILKKGGIIRIVVPDLRVIVDRYLNNEYKSDHFLEDLGVLYEDKYSGLKGKLAPFIQCPHKCMYDSETLLSAMSEIGFTCELKEPFSSGIEDISELEIENRTREAVIVEGVKE